MSNYSRCTLFLFALVAAAVCPVSSFSSLATSGRFASFPLKAAAQDDDGDLTPHQRIVQERIEERATALQITAKASIGRTKALDAKERGVRDHLRRSVRSMREDLLAATTDYEIRTTVNENFVQTSADLAAVIKTEFGSLRKESEDQIQDLQTPLEELLSKIDEVYDAMAPELIRSNQASNLQEVKAYLATNIPEYRTLFGLIDQLCANAKAQIREDGTAELPEGLQKSLDRFETEVNDRLQDLEDDTRFRIRIMEDRRDEERAN